jgi:hypothetical protein
MATALLAAAAPMGGDKLHTPEADAGVSSHPVAHTCKGSHGGLLSLGVPLAFFGVNCYT